MWNVDTLKNDQSQQPDPVSEENKEIGFLEARDKTIMT